MDTSTHNKSTPDWGRNPILPFWARWFVRGGLCLLWVLIRPFTAIRAAWRSRRLKQIPPPPGYGSSLVDSKDGRILAMSAKDISCAVRCGELKCQEVVSAYAGRIRAVNQELNAVVAERLDAAEREAAELDRRLEDGGENAETLRALPLIGVPLTVKGSIAVQGLPNRSGMKESSAALGSECAQEDAPIVARLRAAGALPLLVSNTPELCLWWETRNKRLGTTRNPFAPTRTVGGSSGGEAALLAASASVLSVGSDVGGSLRLPALFCGIYGHKPSPYAVPIDGHLPGTSDPRWPDVFTLGPMCRYSEDLRPALAVMAGPKASELRLDDEVPIQSLRVFALECEPGDCCVAEPVKNDLRQAVKRAADSLHKSGASLQMADFTGLRDVFFMSALLLLRIRDIPSPFHRPEDPQKARGVCSELFRSLLGRSPYALYTLAYTLISRLASKAPSSLVNLCERRRERLRNYIVELLDTDGVLLYPSWPRTAPQDLEISYQLGSATYMIPFNLLGLPVTQVPLGLGSDGLPIGVQVVAAPMQDRLCLAVANHLEKTLGGWVPPWSEELPN